MSNYKAFGISLLVFWILLFIIYLLVSVLYINKIEENSLSLPESIKNLMKDNEIFPYVFWNKNMLYLFIALTFVNFIFSLVHGIYLFSKRKEKSYTKKDVKDILNTTYAGYWLIIGAHIILFLPMTGIFGNLNDISLYTSLAYGILIVIGVILLAVGLSEVREENIKNESSEEYNINEKNSKNSKKSKLKELKSASIVAPVFIGITGILYGIAPACCKLFNIMPSESLTNSLIKELNKQSNKNNNPEDKLSGKINTL